MAILATPKKFSMQQVFDVLLRKPGGSSDPYKIIAYLTDCKTSGLENTVEMVYPTGGAGNVYIGGGFAHSRRATFNVSVATWNTEVLAVQNGTEISTGSQEITYYDSPIEVAADGTAETKFTAVGDTGNEVRYVYRIKDDGTYSDVWTQASTASEGTFTYDTTTKKITFAEDDTNKPVAGEKLACAYTFKSASNAQRLTIASDSIPDVVLVTAYGVAKDVCSGELFPATVEGQAQVDGNWNFDLSADGEPAVQSLNMEFVKGCVDKTLYTFTVYTEDEEIEAMDSVIGDGD
jgi:hypothetical protein